MPLHSFFLSIQRGDKVIINAHAVYKVLSVCLSVCLSSSEKNTLRTTRPLSLAFRRERERERETRRSGKEYIKKCFFSDLN